MVIEYKPSKVIKMNNKLEITDTKNVFLKGKNPDNWFDTFFGIWPNDRGLVVITIIGWHTIKCKCYLDSNVSTNGDIQMYLENNKDVEIIPKEDFKFQIENMRSVMEI